MARNQKAGCDIRNDRLEHSNRKLVMYAFSEAHFPIQKAVELLGLRATGLYIIAESENLEIDI